MKKVKTKVKTKVVKMLNVPIVSIDDDFWKFHRVDPMTLIPSQSTETNIEREKGLSNRIGENNCFLNVIIQSFYHLRPFRVGIMMISEHNHPNENCIFCALKVVLSQYHFEPGSSVSPRALRKALSIVYSLENKFQIGKLADAVEVNDALISCLHQSLQGNTGPCDPPCFVHKIFSINQVQQTICLCNEATFLPFSETVIYVPSEQLKTSRSFRLVADGSVEQSRSLGELIRISRSSGLSCQKCKSPFKIEYELQNVPEVLTIGIVWNTESPSAREIEEILQLVDQEFQISNLFTRVIQSCTYRLRGIVSYYGHHYVAFFCNPQTLEWITFDDKTVKRVGNQWKHVIEKCGKGRLQPLLLWYEKFP